MTQPIQLQATVSEDCSDLIKSMLEGINSKMTYLVEMAPFSSTQRVQTSHFFSCNTIFWIWLSRSRFSSDNVWVIWKCLGFGQWWAFEITLLSIYWSHWRWHKFFCYCGAKVGNSYYGQTDVEKACSRFLENFDFSEENVLEKTRWLSDSREIRWIDSNKKTLIPKSIPF